MPDPQTQTVRHPSPRKHSPLQRFLVKLRIKHNPVLLLPAQDLKGYEQIQRPESMAVPIIKKRQIVAIVIPPLENINS